MSYFTFPQGLAQDGNGEKRLINNAFNPRNKHIRDIQGEGQSQRFNGNVELLGIEEKLRRKAKTESLLLRHQQDSYKETSESWKEDENKTNKAKQK